jgi:hypothetical protein
VIEDIADQLAKLKAGEELVEQIVAETGASPVYV